MRDNRRNHVQEGYELQLKVRLGGYLWIRTDIVSLTGRIKSSATMATNELSSP